MTETAHTPGPWKVCTDPKNPYWRAGVTIGSVPDGTRVADVCDLSARYEANARLIAAAPDLLAFAQEFDHFCLVIDSAVRYDQPTYSPMIAALIKHARAAIAKATGKSHD